MGRGECSRRPCRSRLSSVCRRVSGWTFSRMILATVALSALATWKTRESPATFDQSDHGALVGRAMTATAFVRVVLTVGAERLAVLALRAAVLGSDIAKVGLVGLHDLAGAAHRAAALHRLHAEASRIRIAMNQAVR